MAGIYNPKNSQGDGMLALSDKGSAISQVKSNSIATFATVLKLYKDKATAEIAAGDANAVPLITEHGPAQEEADRDNAFYQSVLGTKEGIAKGVAAQVGPHITDPILRKAASTDTKMVDEYQIEDLFDAVKAGAQRPAATDILTQLTAIVSFCFDFQHKASTNMEILRDSIARLASFGVTVDATQIAIVILANVEYAAKHPWGNEYKHARDTIGRKYQYNHTHDDASIKDILSILEDADKARTMGDAPAPQDMTTMGVAQAVNDAVSALGDYYQEDYASESENKGMAAAVQSDSESSGGNTRTNARRGRGRSRSRARNNERERDSYKNNPCPHCRKFCRHRQHPNISNDQCFWNKKYKGYRPKNVCDEMEIKFVPQWRFKFKEREGEEKE